MALNLASASFLADRWVHPSPWSLPGGQPESYKCSYPIDDDPRHILVGWLQSICKLGVHVQELCATVPHCTFHDGVWGHLWGIDLQALRAQEGQ